MKLGDIVLGDTASFSGTVYANGAAMDCTGYTLTYEFKGPEDTAANEIVCSWVSQSGGTWTLAFLAASLDHVGDWEGRFRLDDAPDVVHTFEDFPLTVKAGL